MFEINYKDKQSDERSNQLNVKCVKINDQTKDAKKGKFVRFMAEDRRK